MPIGQSSVELVTKYGNHLYQSDQKTYPSVTTILDCVAYNQHIVGWANYLGFKHIRYEDTLKQTADRGTYVHAFNQYYVASSWHLRRAMSFGVCLAKAWRSGIP